jgi:hypothetical protein
LIVCDDCEKIFHLSCLPYPLNQVPAHEWNCVNCILNTGKNYGFKDNEDLRDFTEFKTMADQFKAKFLKQSSLSEYEVEKNFWRLLSNPFHEVDVEYGADLHTSIHGRYLW